MKESMGDTQVKEIIFSENDVNVILLENIKARMNTPYDFDYDRPIIMRVKDTIYFRFVQKKITREYEPRTTGMKPITTEE